MNQEKAKEFYSAHFEGTLESGLKQTFEQKLRSDAVLRADYQAFVKTVASLDWLKTEDIEVPSFLSDRIATRLEAARAQKSSQGLFAWLTPARWALAGLATVALVGGSLSIMNTGSGKSVANLWGVIGPEPSPKTAPGADSSMVSVVPVEMQMVSVSDGKNSTRLQPKSMQPLVNTQAEPVTFTVQVEGDKQITYVVVPGTQRSVDRKGTGTLLEFAHALSGVYQKPVQLKISDVTRTVTWNFDGTDALKDATQALDQSLYAVDLQTAAGTALIRSSYLISVRDH